MPRIKRSEELSVNVKEIDEQHRKWIAITNRLHETLMKGDTFELLKIASMTLKDMREYTKVHFSREEEFMKTIGYPDLEAHKRLHDIFFARILQLDNEVQEGKVILQTKIMKDLSNWFKNHILSEDKKFARFHAEKQGE